MRSLSDFEKQLAIRISKKSHGTYLSSLLDNYIKGLLIRVKLQEKMVEILILDNEADSFVMSRQLDQIYKTIIEAVNLIELLEQENYITTAQAAHHINDPFEFGPGIQNEKRIAYRLPDAHVTTSLIKYLNRILYSTQALEDYLNATVKQKRNPIMIYRRMSFMQKLSFWGSIASIIGVLLFFYPFHAQSGNVNVITNGAESPAIGENSGNININYNSASLQASKTNVLRKPQGGSVLVVSSPDLNNAQKPSSHVCNAVAGTPIVLLNETTNTQNIEWQKIKITNGPCSNKIGWTVKDNISYE